MKSDMLFEHYGELVSVGQPNFAGRAGGGAAGDEPAS